MLTVIEFDRSNHPDMDTSTVPGLRRYMGVTPRTMYRILEACGLLNVERFKECQIGLILECRKLVSTRKETYQSFGAKLDEFFSTSP